MTTFFTSDLHFGHKNILKYCPPRGARWESADSMTEGLIERWNSIVRSNDEVWTLGDTFFCREDKALEIMVRLNGKKHLILGNHDQLILKSTALQAKFESIQHYKEIHLHNARICLFHFPMVSWHQMHHGAWHLHGHCHNTLPPHGRRVDVGIDNDTIMGHADHRPFSIDEVNRWMRDREVASPEDVV